MSTMVICLASVGLNTGDYYQPARYEVAALDISITQGVRYSTSIKKVWHGKMNIEAMTNY
jgi:hypothetical protein